MSSALPSMFALMRAAVGILKKDWRLFATITLLYAVLYGILVQAASSVSLSDLRSETGSVPATAQFLNSQGNGSLVQAVLLLLMSLALIRALRQVSGDGERSLADAFYNGMTPLVPAILLSLLIIVQLLPLVLGLALLQILVSVGAAGATAVLVLGIVITLGLALLSMYWIVVSIIAFYTVTLPSMRPVRALRLAKGVLRNRRWTALRKLFMVPVIFVIISIVVIGPVALAVPALANVAAALSGALVLTAAHAYLYTLYKALMAEGTEI